MRYLVVLAVVCGGHATARPSFAEEFVYFASLSGPAELPPNGSPGTGTALIVLDDTLAHLHVEINFNGLTGTVSSAHLQGLTALPGLGVADSATSLPTLSGFISGVTSGFYHGVLDLNSEPMFNAAFIDSYGGIGPARAALANGLSTGQMYFNIRTSAFPDGEIRGFLAPSPTADFDRNGQVDVTDLTLWRLAFDEATFADADKDGDADGADLLAWQRQLGSRAELPSHHHVAPESLGAPEPAAAGLATLGVIGLNAMYRRRTSLAPAR